MAAGRPAKYKKEYCEEIIEYFTQPRTKKVKVEEISSKNGKRIDKYETQANEFPQLADFAHKIGVDRATLWRWTEEHEEFRNAYKKAKELQESWLVENGFKGLTNPAFTIFAAKNICGWRDKKEIEMDGEVKVRMIDGDESL